MIILGVSIASFFCAIFSGMFGMAGGLMLLAILFIIDFPNEVAIPLHGIVMLISYSSAFYIYKRHISMKSTLIFLIATIPGLLVSYLFLGKINRHIAQIIISVIIIYLTWAPRKLKISNPFDSIENNMKLAGFLGAFFSITIGAAGTLTAPLYLRKEWNAKTLVGTKIACGAILQILKIGTYSLMGFKPYDYLNYIIPISFSFVSGNLVGIYFVSKITGHKYHILYKAVLSFAIFALLIDVVNDVYEVF